MTESDFDVVECYREDNQCRITCSCRLPQIINRALQAMLDVLDQYSLADLILDDRIFEDLSPESEKRNQPVRRPRQFTTGDTFGS